MVSLTLTIGTAAGQQMQQQPQQTQNQSTMDTVIVASAASSQDTVAASGPSQKLGIPILHVQEDSVPEATQSALETLQPGEIMLIGGPEAISQQAETELENYANTTRI